MSGQMRVVDAHNDLLCAVLYQRERGFSDPFGDFWLPRLRSGGVVVQFLPVFTEDQHLGEGALRRALLMLEEARSIASVHSSDVAIVETSPQLTDALAANKIALILAVEGSEPVGHSLGVLDTLWRLGVRCMSLTWNRRTMMADGVGETATGGGLTALGVEAVAEMERLGIIVDVSHLSNPGVDHVSAIATRPFVATHSSCHALHPHPRNLTDAQMRAIGDSGGVVGINSFGAFLAADQPKLDDYATHIEHAVQVVGANSVGLGCDFMDDLLRIIDPILGGGLVDTENLPIIDGMRDPTDLKGLTDVLADRLGVEKARLVAGDSWIDFLTASLPTGTVESMR